MQCHCVTDASLTRVRLFSEILRSDGYLTAAEYAELVEEDRELTASIDEAAITTIYLTCAETTRLRRLSLRMEKYPSTDAYNSIQRKMDRAQIARTRQLERSKGNIVVATDGDLQQVTQRILISIGF